MLRKQLKNMRIYILKDKERSQNPIYYILSYLKQYSKLKFETITISIENIKDIKKSQNDFFLFSFSSIKKYINLLDIINELRGNNIHINIVIGGTAIGFFDHKNLMKLFPEIKYVVIGVGEDLIKQILEGKIKPGIYDERQSGIIYSYYLEEEYYDKINENCFLLMMEGNRCPNKCAFCQKSLVIKRKKRNENFLLFEIKKLYSKGIKYYYIYDNYLNHNKFKQLLFLCIKEGLHDIKFTSTGAHVSVDYLKVYKDIKEVWEQETGYKFPLESIGLGVEFYSQKILDLYNKNSYLWQIDRAIDQFNELGIYFSAYIINGLPGVTEKDFFQHKEWLEKRCNDIPKIGFNYFRLSSKTEVFKNKEKFNLEIKDRLTTKDYFYPTRIDPIIDTEFFDYDLPFGGSRFEIKKLYDTININNSEFNIDLRNAFLEKSYKWKKFI
jgi:radical SAM superfamily enzyme YgiQ (UPF0313 family)